MYAFKVTAVGIAILAVVVGLCFGGYEAYWALAGHNADHQAHVDRSNYNFQQTYREQVTSHLGDFNDLSTKIIEDPADAAQLKAQRLAILDIVCQNAEQVTGDSLPANQAAFVSANCLDGQHNPESVYAQTGN